jgi:hypothetical protein
VYANRRRTHGERGKRLQSQRGEKIERNFAHQFDTGGMDRLYLRGRENVHKRLLVQAAACNLALWLRSLYGIGKPKATHDITSAAFLAFVCLLFKACSQHSADLILRPSSHPLRKEPAARRRLSCRFSKNGWFRHGLLAMGAALFPGLALCQCEAPANIKTVVDAYTASSPPLRRCRQVSVGYVISRSLP